MSQIVATIGPASSEKSIITDMLAHGLGVIRLNFSWGTHEEHAVYIRTVREVAREQNVVIPIIQDLSGPRIQTGEGHGFNEEAIEVITEKDRDDLTFGLSQGVEYIALSYVGAASDVIKLKDIIAVSGGTARVIAKIERKMALQNLDEIIAVADAIMVARGDLGNEIPLEKIPFVEKDIIARCNTAGKPVITATQMLLSMTENETPTRAEVVDVAFAILSGSDAVMLSEETARGKYPVLAVDIMKRTIREAELHMSHDGDHNHL